MNCPVCAAELRPVLRQDIEVDICTRCRGVWLDRGELDRLVDRAARPAGVDDDTGEWQRQTRPDRQDPERKGFLGRFFDFD